MMDLLIAIDLEVKFHRLREADSAVDRLATLSPRDMRRLFTFMYKAYPSRLLLEYEVTREEHSAHHVAHAMVA